MAANAEALEKGFDDEHWLYDPVSGSATPRDKCGTCGHTIFLYAERKESESGSRYLCGACEKCYQELSYRMKRPGDRIYARFDVVSMQSIRVNTRQNVPQSRN
jgi:ribosomal protein S27AE